MDLGLAGKTALVLGGGGGLGSAIARTLAREGAQVAVAGRSLAPLEAVVSAIRADNGKALALEWDLGDLARVDDRIGRVEAALGPVDVLVNNTGGPPPSPAAGQPASTWQAQFEAMVLSVIAITDRVLPSMRQRGWGRIITSTSSGVVAPISNLAISNALRLTLLGWSKTLAREVARDGITVNVVVPGRIATPRVAFLDDQKAHRESRAAADVAAESIAAIPLGRYGEPQEYANVVAFLAGTAASYMTGSVVRVDGGLIQSL
ncbi:SDR family oxidoreductase [Lichenicoccus sp.]|uniref:SDR family oxidoreductase n=1 Tax=Lichenicoccus sp. TaxID=2781899 RepID=UPI003D0F5BFE